MNSVYGLTLLLYLEIYRFCFQIKLLLQGIKKGGNKGDFYVLLKLYELQQNILIEIMHINISLIKLL